MILNENTTDSMSPVRLFFYNSNPDSTLREAFVRANVRSEDIEQVLFACGLEKYMVNLLKMMLDYKVIYIDGEKIDQVLRDVFIKISLDGVPSLLQDYFSMNGSGKEDLSISAQIDERMGRISKALRRDSTKIMDWGLPEDE